MAIPKDQLTKIKVTLRDRDDQLVKMIDYIKHTANIGHSFEVVVDPDMSEYRKRFSMDGDGSFAIAEVKKDGVKYKEDIIKEYLNRIQ